MAVMPAAGFSLLGSTLSTIAVIVSSSFPAVSKTAATTCVTEPLTDEGHPDYVAVLNQRCSEGVTPETNAAVLFWQALGPDGVPYPRRYFEMLGVETLPQEGDYLVRPWRFLQSRDETLSESTLSDLASELRDKLDQLRQRPWSARDYPVLAAWMEATERPLRVAHGGTRLANCYGPLIPSDDMPDVAGVLLPLTQQSYWLARAFTARAMLRLEAGDVDGAWEDILACYRLSRLIGQQPYLVQMLVACKFNRFACEATWALAEHGELSADQLRRFRGESAALPPVADLVATIDVGERFSVLDTLIRNIMRDGGVMASRDPAEFVSRVWAQCQIAGSFNWDEILRIQNDYLDRMVECLQEPRYRERQQGIERLLAAYEKVRQAYPRRPASAAFFGGFATFGGSCAEARHLLLAIARSEQDRRKRTKLAADGLSGLLPAISAADDEYTEARVEMELTQLVLALAAYRAEHGRYPEKLSALLPGELGSVPQDEFTEQGFDYRRQGAGFRLSSFGPNGRDDRGQEDDILIQFASERTDVDRHRQPRDGSGPGRSKPARQAVGK